VISSFRQKSLRSISTSIPLEERNNVDAKSCHSSCRHCKCDQFMAQPDARRRIEKSGSMRRCLFVNNVASRGNGLLLFNSDDKKSLKQAFKILTFQLYKHKGSRLCAVLLRHGTASERGPCHKGSGDVVGRWARLVVPYAVLHHRFPRYIHLLCHRGIVESISHVQSMLLDTFFRMWE